MGFRLRRRLWRAALVVVLMSAVLCLEALLLARPRALPPPASPDDDSLQSAVGGHNIFFIEPTCVFKEMPWFGLRILQACAVESAVRHNKDYNVYVLHTCAFPFGIVDMNVPDGAKAVYAPLDFFFRNTELDPSIISSNTFRAQKNSVERAKEILSIVTLWKYGGIFLNLDSIIQRPLRGLAENWLLVADSGEMSLRALKLSAAPLSPGRQVAAWALRSLHMASPPPASTARLVTTMLEGRCGFHTVDIGAVTDCYGIALVPERMFLPVPEIKWRHLYLEDLSREAQARLQRAFAVCFHHELADAPSNPNAAFGRLGKQHCPTVSNPPNTRR